MSGKTDSKVLGLKASDTVGDWVVVKKLGRGGCGAVFEVCAKVGYAKLFQVYQHLVIITQSCSTKNNNITIGDENKLYNLI